MSSPAGKAPRKSLLQLQGEVTVKDPSVNARRQVSELDKTAKKSLDKRKACNEQTTADRKEIEQLTLQIAQIHKSYDPLCALLQENKDKKAALLKTLEQCMQEQKRMMGEMSNTVTSRKQDDSKLSRKMASQKLESERGFGLGPETTFKQHRS